MDVTSVLEHAEADDRRTLMTSVTVVFLVISWLSVFSRTYVRGFIIHSFGWDDAIMLLAAVRVLHPSSHVGKS